MSKKEIRTTSEISFLATHPVWHYKNNNTQGDKTAICCLLSIEATHFTVESIKQQYHDLSVCCFDKKLCDSFGCNLFRGLAYCFILAIAI